jgi:uncharacterized integral membrane protein
MTVHTNFERSVTGSCRLHSPGVLDNLTITMYLIALVVVFILGGVFAAQNDGTQSFAFLGYTWTLQTWVPTAIGTGVMGLLLLLHMSHAGLGGRLRQIGQSRTLDEHRDVIDQLRTENSRLREELAAVKGQVRGAATAGSGSSFTRTLGDSVRGLTGRDRTGVA